MPVQTIENSEVTAKEGQEKERGDRHMKDIPRDKNKTTCRTPQTWENKMQ